MATIEKPRCPDARRNWFGETDMCAIEDKMCLLESGTDCEIYREFLAKAEHDNVESK